MLLRRYEAGLEWKEMVSKNILSGVALETIERRGSKSSLVDGCPNADIGGR